MQATARPTSGGWIGQLSSAAARPLCAFDHLHGLRCGGWGIYGGLLAGMVSMINSTLLFVLPQSTSLFIY